MKKRALSSIVAIILSFVLVFAVVGCTSDSGVTLSQTELTMGVGDIQNLRATTEDNSDVVWSSSDDTVATVLSGMITAKKVGEATITATSKSAGSATCKVTVADFVVTLSQTTATVEKGEPFTLTASTTMNGQPYSGDKYTWSSENESIATVSGGTVTGIREGTVKITARRSAGTASASCEVTVNWTNKPEGYYEIEHYEQNKVPQNTWGRWANQGWEGGGRINMNLAEYQNSADSQAGIASFNFTVETHGTLAGADLQVVYRSAGEGGSFKTGTYYSLTADVTSSVAGDITLNGTDFTLEANEKTTITSYFLHADDGTRYPDGTYDNIYYTAVFLLLGNLGESGDTIDFTIEKLQWKEFTPEALKAPTVTVAEKKATIADTNENGVKEYTIGFFSDAEAEAPVYTMKHAVKGENTIKDDIFENGTYVVRAMAHGADARYLQSAWSEADDVTFTVNNEHVSYDLAQGTEAEAIDDAGRYYYSGNLTEGKYLDGTITFNIPTGGNWYDNQLFFENVKLQSGTQYKLTFNLKVSGLPELPAGITAWKIRVNGTMFEIENGDNRISVPYTESASGGQDGSSMHIQFGEPSSDYSSTIATVTGAYEMTDISWEEVTHVYKPGPMETDTAAEAACNGTWLYWASQGEGNCTVTATEVTSSYDEATDTYGVTAKFSSAGSLPYGFQVFHNDSAKFPNGTNVKLTLTIKATTALTLTIDGKSITLVANEAQDVEVTRVVNYTGDWQGATLFGMAVNCTDGLSTELTLTNIKFEAVGAPAPTPENHPKAEDYDLGEAITPTGTELVKGDKPSSNKDPDKWYYWYVEDEQWNCGSVVTLTDPKFENGTFSCTYNGGSKDFCTQLFYTTSAIDAAKQYFLTVTIETDKPVRVGLHGEKYQLTAGTHTLTAIKPASGTALSIQFDAVTEATSIKVSNVKWQEIKGGTQPQPEPPTPGTKYQPSYDKKIQGAEMTSEWDKVGTDNNPDTWVYWYVADASWNQGAVVNEFAAEFEGNAFVVSYKDGEKDYSVQVFYKNSQLLAGQIYTLTCKINASVQTKAIINGKEMTLNAGDNTITVVFTLNAAGAEQNGVSAIDFQFPMQAQTITLKISDVEWTAGDTTSGTQPETPAGGKEISVTATDWYGDSFVKLSMSDEDFALVKEAASCKVNGADTKAFGEGKGFLVDGNLLQVQLSEAYGEGKTYSVVWYDAEGNAIAHATFSYTA